MKSKPQDKTLQTSCKECLFSVYEKNTQTGCLANRIEMFKQTARGDIIIAAYDDEKEFYVVDGLCNYFRPPSWNKGKADLNKAIDESKTTFSIMIYADQINEDNLSRTQKSIQEIDYEHSKISVVISHDLTMETQQKKIVTKLYEFLAQDLNIDTKINAYLSETQQDYEAFRKVQGLYFIRLVVNDKNTVSKNTFSNIDAALNNRAVRAVVFDDGNAVAIAYTVFLTRFKDYEDFNEFQSAIMEESQSVNLYHSLEE